MSSKTSTKPSSSAFSVIMTPEGRKLYIETELLKAAFELFKAGRNIAFLGEPGVAKTDLARAMMAMALTAGRIKAIYSQEYGGIVSGDLLDGERTLDDNGKLTIIPSQWLQAVRHAATGEAVGIINDEHNRGTPQGINKQLRSFSHQEYSSDLDGLLTWTPDNLLTISTLNVGFNFSGTSRVDQALGDRFYPLIIEPPPAPIVDTILNDRYPGIDEKVKKGVLTAYTSSRNSEDAYKLTVRDVLKVTDGVLIGGMSLKNSVQRLIGGMVRLNGMPEESVESLVTAMSAVGV
jgi:hypothetical protein